MRKINLSLMDDWFLSDHVEPGAYFEHRISPSLFDDDGVVSDDDQYTTLPDEEEPTVKIKWATQNIVVSREKVADVFPASFTGPERLRSTDPWRWCTRSNPVSICFRVSTLEARP